MAKAGPTKSQAEDQTPVQVTDAQWDSNNLSAGNDRYWEVDLGDHLGEAGKKRKWSDDEDTPPPEGFSVRDGLQTWPQKWPPGQNQEISWVFDGCARPGSTRFEASFLWQFGRSHPRTPIDFVTSVNSVTVKPKPRPRPIKGKVSTELGIITRDQSKKIAEESVRTTRSKKHLV